MQTCIISPTLPFRVRGSAVVLKYHEQEEQKVGKIVIPGETNKLFIEALVVGVGPGSEGLMQGKTDDLKVGDIVIVLYQTPTGAPATQISVPQFRKIGQPISYAGETYYIHKQIDIIGVYCEGTSCAHCM